MQNKYAMVDCITGGQPYQNTLVATDVTERYIRVSFVCDNINPSAKHTSYNAPLYEGDIVEILLTLGDINRYLEIEVNPNAALYVAVINNKDGKGDIEIDFLGSHQVDYASIVENGVWTVDITLPTDWLKSLGYQNNEYWNLLREDFDNQGVIHLSCISPTYLPSFHQTKAFIRVI